MLEFAAVVQEQEYSLHDQYTRAGGYGEQFKQLANVAIQLEPAKSFVPFHERSAELIAKDTSEEITFRQQSLEDWLQNSPKKVASFVADELLDHQAHPSEWLATLVRFAELVVFPSDQCASIASSLLMAAEQFKSLDEPSSSENCWSAIHRAGSLMPVEKIESFLSVLDGKGFVDTRLAALQSINSVLESEPPNKIGSHPELRSRVATLGAKVLDPDVFVAGEVSAIGIECTLALAALTNDGNNPILDLVLQLDRPWLEQAIACRYGELIDSWQHESVRIDAIDLLKQDLARLTRTV